MQSGTAVIRTCGETSTLATTLYVRKGSCLSTALADQISCNQEFCQTSSGNQDGVRLAPMVEAGTTYYIVVDGFLGASGTFTLTVIPPLI